MSFSMEMYNLLIRYTKDKEGLEITLADLRSIPYWRCVWGWWMALAYYKIDDNYERIEDVPEGLENYSVISGDIRTSYFSVNGTKKSQDMTRELCKSVYGA